MLVLASPHASTNTTDKDNKSTGNSGSYASSLQQLANASDLHNSYIVSRRSIDGKVMDNKDAEARERLGVNTGGKVRWLGWQV